MRKAFRMDQLIRVLTDRLVGKGVEISTIPAYIRDFSNTNEIDNDLSLHELNRRMRILGWYDFELDNHTLQLLIAVLETNGSWRRGRPLSLKSTSNPGKFLEQKDFDVKSE